MPGLREPEVFKFGYIKKYAQAQEQAQAQTGTDR
jgi:hypothetical protein